VHGIVAIIEDDSCATTHIEAGGPANEAGADHPAAAPRQIAGTGDDAPLRVGATRWVAPTFPIRRPPGEGREFDASNEVGRARAVPATGRIGTSGPASGSIGALIGQFKSIVTRRIREHLRRPRMTVWQRNYFEHVIRSDESLDRIRQYVVGNPARWEFDRENPKTRSPDPEDAWRS
jgi:hypothetical protein